MLALITVDNLNNGGPGSLRTAILEANAAPTVDEIQFAVTGTIAINSQLPNINDHLTITGPGASALTIDAGHGTDGLPATADGYRIFNINNSDSSVVEVAISGLTLTGGDATGTGTLVGGGAVRNFESLALANVVVHNNASKDRGGGIYSFGDLTIVDSEIRENSTTSTGGGIYAREGVIEVTRSRVTNNSSTSSGGGMAAFGIDATIVDSTFSENFTTAPGGRGGGIFNEGQFAEAHFRIVSSTVSNNFNSGADSDGGGIAGGNSGFTLVNSTVSGNSTQRHGGGLYTRRGTIAIDHSTFTNNSAGGLGGGISQDAQNFVNGGFLDIENMFLSHALVAGNTDSGAAPDFLAPAGNGSELTVEHSLIGDNTGTTLAAAATPDADGNLIGTSATPIDPLLASLASDGGPTQTHLPMPGSPAIDAGDPDFAAPPDFDQRGKARVANGRIDIGAVEFQTDEDVFLVVDTTLDEQDFDYSEGDLSLREAIFIANEDSGFNTILFSPLFDTPQTIALALGELEISNELTITGPGQDLLTIDAQQESRVLNYSSLSGDLRISGVSLKNGNAPECETDAGSDAFLTCSGGAISFLSEGTLAVTDSSIEDNTMGGAYGYGGGIFSDSGDVVIEGSTLTGNRTAGYFGDGGAIHTKTGDITLTNSTVSDNRVNAFAFGFGGGIASASGNVTLISSTVTGNSTQGTRGVGGGIRTGSGDITLVDSTVSDNESHGDGGGIESLSGEVTLIDSTLSGNTTHGNGAEGGAIFTFLGSISLFGSTISGNRTLGNEAPGGGIATNSTQPLSFIHSTITDNSTVGNGSDGGGIWLGNGQGGQELSVQHSIIANNSVGPNSQAPNLAAQIFSTTTLSATFSLIGDNTGTGFAESQTPDANGNLIGTAENPIDPLLGPLANNGGPTQTHALLPGSPAIDRGDPTMQHDLTQFDQRGEPFLRVADGDMLTVIVIDIGAYEAQIIPSADFDIDGDVDGADFLRWQRGFGKVNAQRADGNSDDDTDSDASDLTAWQVSYGQPQTLVAVALGEQSALGSAELIDTAMALEWLDNTADEEVTDLLAEPITSDAGRSASAFAKELPTIANSKAKRASSIDDSATTTEPSEPWLANELLERVFG